MNQNLLKLGKQLQAIWKELGLNQRISIVLAAAVVIAGIASIGLWSSRADYALLYGKLDDAEASKVIAALNDLKVPYKISPGGGAIQVPSDKVHLMRMQLAAKGIPRGDGVGFEIFDKPNFGISDFVQRANYMRAMQGELARTISQLNEVEAARVMIVMPENRLLVDSSKHPTASVFVRVRGNTALPAESVNSIRFLVANSVEGLKANDVSVVDNHGNVLSENNDSDTIVGLSSSQLALRRNLEQYLSKKAEGMLEKVLGPGQAAVRVSAEINLDTVTRTEEKFDPEGQVVRISTINDENNDTTTSNPVASGAAGASTNVDTETNTVASASVNNSRLKKKITNNQYEINKTTSNVVQSAGGIKRVSAAVFVAQRFEGEGANRKPAPRSPEDLEKLRRIVQNALGIQSEEGQGSAVTLEEMAFNEQTSIEISKQLETTERRQFWWELGGNLIYPILGLAILFVFFRMFKKTSVEEIPIGIPLNQLNGAAFNGNGKAHTNGNGHANGNGHLNGHGHPRNGIVTVDVLNQLIRENPDNMTLAIRNWMGRDESK